MINATRFFISSRRAFTLLEVMVVVVIIGIIAAFAIPDYSRSIQKSHERDMLSQLTVIHAANLLYRSYAGEYWDTGGTNQGLASINTTLSLNIIANDGTTYSYNSANGSGFTATAAWQGFTLRVTDDPISTGTPPNPCCFSNNCLAVADC